MPRTTSETDGGAGSDKARATRAALIRSACDFFVEDGYGLLRRRLDEVTQGADGKVGR